MRGQQKHSRTRTTEKEKTMEEGFEALLKVAGMIAGAGLELAGKAMDSLGEEVEQSGIGHFPYTGTALKVAGKAIEFLQFLKAF